MIDGYTVTEIAQYAFSQKYDDARSLVGFNNMGEEVVVVIPDTIVIIGEKAFFCTNIEGINIPASVQAIGIGAFAGTNCKISVDSGNTTFATIEGNLYNKKQKELIYFSKLNSEGTFIIPEGIVSIGDYACFREYYLGQSFRLFLNILSVFQSHHFRLSKLSEAFCLQRFWLF